MERGRIEFELTDADLREVYDRYYRTAYRVGRGELKGRTRTLMFVAAGVLGVALFAMLFVRADGGAVPMPAVIVCLVLLCTVLATLVDNRGARRREASVALERTMESCVLDSLLGRWTVELTAEGVRADYAAETRLIKWAGVWGFHLDDGFASIVGIDSRSIVIPLRAFDEPREDNAAAFVAAGESLLAASGHGFRSRMAEHLASHDVPCPRCKYNLRGSLGGSATAGREPGVPRCPECGWMLTPANVPEAFGRRGAHT